MNKVGQVNSLVNSKKEKKTIPKTNNLIKTLKIGQIPQNLLHNIEDPVTYMTNAKQKGTTKIENFRKLLQGLGDFDQKQEIYKKILNDPDFLIKDEEEFTIDEFKNYINDSFIKLVKIIQFDYEKFKDIKNLIEIFDIAGLISPSLATKVAVHYGLYCKSIQNLGTDKHLQRLKKGVELKDLGCFMMTEIAHGSNVQSLLTFAHYNHEDRSFILNTPHEHGMKFWIGNLAKTANWGVCFANLIIDQKNYGIHIFLVQIRNEKGQITPGINLGDCGPKLGINGVDNGWAIFRKVKIPYDNLLDKYSQIDQQGNFQSEIKGKNQRFALQLSALSGGRLLVANSCTKTGLLACGITSRYTSVRKQFGGKKYQEQVLMDYPIIQKKIFTNMAMNLSNFCLVNKLIQQCASVDMTNLENIKVKELHALCSYSKGEASEQSLQTVLEMRDLCGGHGFSIYSKFPTFLRCSVVQTTWEGSNGVLIQQTAKFLLTQFSSYIQKGKILLKNFKFLKDFEDEEKMNEYGKTAVKLLTNFEISFWMNNFEQCLESILCLLRIRLKSIGEIVAENFAIYFDQKRNLFQSFNSTLPDGLLKASKLYGEYETVISMKEMLIKTKNQNLKNEHQFMIKLSIIYCLQRIMEETIYLNNLLDLEFVKNSNRFLMQIFESLKYDALIFTDSVLPPDEILRSSVGISNGNVYQNIMNRVRSDYRNLKTEQIWRRNKK